jgi:hypothetical protein
MQKMPPDTELATFREYLIGAFREALAFVADHATDPDAFLSHEEFAILRMDRDSPRMPELEIGSRTILAHDYSTIFKTHFPRSRQQTSEQVGQALFIPGLQEINARGQKDWFSTQSYVGEEGQARLGGAVFPPERFPAVQRLTDWLDRNDKFRDYFTDHLFMKRYTPFIITNMIANAVDRYIHLFGTMTFLSSQGVYISDMLINSIISPILRMSLAIPIANTAFDFDFLQITPDFYIMRMPRRFQLARVMDAIGGKACSRGLVAATHAFVVKDMEIANNSYNAINWSLMHVRNYPTEHIENFLGSLRVVTGISTGYAQILAIPRRWASHYVADLTPLHGVFVRRYPDSFDSHLPVPSTVSRREAEEVSGIFMETLDRGDNRVSLALKRLNRCFLRDDLEDAILDAAIILELLLSDSDSEALSYKIRMRSAALALADVDRSKIPEQVRKDIKTLYDRRSAIVHGGTRRKKNKEVSIEPDDVGLERAVLMEPVRYVMSMLLKNPKYLEQGRIDSELLLRYAGDKIDEQGTHLDGVAREPATSP